jgi:hypothetical protein
MKDVHLKDLEGNYKKINVSTQFSQLYSDALEVVSKVTTPSALHLLFWVLGRMNDMNIVALRKNEKLEFIFDCHSSGGVKYSVSAVNKAIGILKEKKVIMSWNNDKERIGMYLVNPRYFWKGKDQKQRLEYIVDTDYYNKIKANETN